MIVFDDVIADIISNKKLQQTVAWLFIRGREINIFLVFITQCYFSVPKIIRLNYTPYSIINVSNKQELQQSAFNHSSNIDFEDFMSL